MAEEDYTVKKYKRVLFYSVMLAMFLAYIVGQYIYPSERDVEYDFENIVYSGEFYWEKTDGSEEKISVPGSYDVQAGDTMVLRTQLPQDYDEHVIALRGSMENVRIYIDGDLRTVYDTEETRPFGKNSASRYVFCETSSEDAGKEMRIELCSYTAKYSGVVNTVYCGDRFDIWSLLFHQYLKETVIAFFMLFAGIVVLVFSLALGIVYKTRFDLEYIGWCMLMGAVWMLGESKIRQLLVPNASILGNTCFFVVMLCPIPILFYMDSVQRGRYQKVYHVIECASCVDVVLCTALQIFNIADFIETLPLMHIVMAVSFITIFVTIIRDIMHGDARSYELPLIGMVTAMVFAMLEVTSVYRVVSLSGIFIAIGLIVLLLMTVIQTMYTIRELERRLQWEIKESYDYLTGLPMRHKGEKMISEKMQNHSGCLCFVDMGNLKKINDIYGHKAGDRALKLLGTMITECMKGAIACRLGGDEFLFYLPDVTEGQVRVDMKKFFERFHEEKNTDLEIHHASLSGGLCMCAKGDKLDECYLKADKALYYVKQNGKDNFLFYSEMEDQTQTAEGKQKDLEVIAKTLQESGNYDGALNLDYREFAKIYEYMNNLGSRYKHSCCLVLVTMDTKPDQTMYIEHIEKAVQCMEKSIRENIRKVDICTRYSSLQHLIILLEPDEAHIPEVLDRIFINYQRAYGKNDFMPRYEYMKIEK